MHKSPFVLLSACLMVGLMPLEVAANSLAIEKQAGHRPCDSFQIAAGRSPSLEIANGNGVLSISKSSRRLAASLDGRAVPRQRLVEEDDVVRVVGSAGETLFMVGTFGGWGRDGQLAYSPDLDPTSVRSRLGFKLRGVGPDLATQLNLEGGVVVSEVCDGLPASRAGLEKHDVILEAEGLTPVSSKDLQSMVAAKGPGEALDLVVLRRGERRQISMATGPIGDWPDGERYAEYLRTVVND
ncbi:MAG: PDZ domain-containing protein [Acidobacteriota bacterium]